jgi:hypothetical protein
MFRSYGARFINDIDSTNIGLLADPGGIRAESDSSTLMPTSYTSDPFNLCSKKMLLAEMYLNSWTALPTSYPSRFV